MFDDWSQQEVEIIVQDYLTMLAFERLDQKYNKAQRNRELQKFLPARNRSAIEFKHQNISAAMIELGYPYVEGYKPLGHRQTIIYEIIETQIAKKPDLLTVIANSVEKKAEKPSQLTDVLKILVEAPRLPKKRDAIYEQEEAPHPRPRRNYLEIEAHNQSLGRAGEELAIEFEQQRLWREGRKDLAGKIDHVANSKGDSCGFDILSFETDSRERLIEVKTTQFGALTPFFASSNEVAVSERRSDEYYVYRLFDFSKVPRLFLLNGSMRSTCSLEAVQFRAMPGTIDA